MQFILCIDELGFIDLIEFMLSKNPNLESSLDYDTFLECLRFAPINYIEYSWLFLAVFIGGNIGTYLGIKTFHPVIVRRLTAILVIYVGLRILIGF